MNFITGNVIKMEAEECRYFSELLFFYKKYFNIVNRKNFKNLPLLLQMSYSLNAIQYEKLFSLEKEKIENKYNVSLKRDFVTDVVNNLIIFE